MLAKNLLIQLQELHCDSKIGKDRHFIAAERKNGYGKKIGIIIVIINVIIGSTLFTLIPDDNSKKIVLSIISLFAASLAAIQTFFNYSKDAENHRKIGNLYLGIVLDTDVLIARFKDEIIDEKMCQSEYQNLIKKYTKINKKEEICSNYKGDYKTAYFKNKASKERIKFMKEENNRIWHTS